MTPEKDNNEFIEWETCGVYEERCGSGATEYMVVYKKAFKTYEEALMFKEKMLSLKKS